MKRYRFRIVIILLFVTATALYATLTTTNYPAKNQTETITLAGLGAGNSRQAVMINNDSTTNDIDLQMYVIYKVGTAPNANGTIIVYMYACFNSSTANCIDAGEITGADAAVTIPATGTILPFAVGPTCYANVASTTYKCGPFSAAQTFGNSVPSGVGLVINNNSGQALDATCTGCGIIYDRVQLKNQ